MHGWSFHMLNRRSHAKQGTHCLDGQNFSRLHETTNPSLKNLHSPDNHSKKSTSVGGSESYLYSTISRAAHSDTSPTHNRLIVRLTATVSYRFGVFRGICLDRVVVILGLCSFLGVFPLEKLEITHHALLDSPGGNKTCVNFMVPSQVMDCPSQFFIFSRGPSGFNRVWHL